MLCTALDLQLDPAKVAAWSNALRTVAATAAPKVRFEALQVLAEHYGPEDLGSLIPHLDDADGDVRAGVALALLGIADSDGQKGLR
jgi:HEAT repeat protein